MKPLTAGQFTRLARKGLHDNVTYSFTSRTQANLAATFLREETTWEIVWVGPQQFEVR